MKGTVMYPEPRVMYLRSGWGIDCVSAIGETSRSWLVGHSWKPSKYQKREYEVATEHDYNEWHWMLKHARPISRAICPDYGHSEIDPATLRKIAELIGYEGK